MEIEELKAKYLNKEFDEKEFPVRAEAMVDFATTVGETAPYYTDPAHPDFRAVPTFPARFHGRRMLPADFPKIGLPLDGGKAVMPQAPIRAGVTLIGKSHLHEIYEKTGRTGRMIFLISRMEVFHPDGHLVSIVDSRQVIRERPPGAQPGQGPGGAHMEPPAKSASDHHETRQRQSAARVAASAPAPRSGAARAQRGEVFGAERSSRRMEDVEFGEEIPPLQPDFSIENVRKFGRAAEMVAPRFSDHEGARKEGLPGAIVPGVMSQAILVAMIHRWAGNAELEKIDTVFRAPVLVDHEHAISAVVTNLEPETRSVDIDLSVVNEAGETRVLGTARVKLP